MIWLFFGKSPQELQNNLNSLKSYCDTWGLKVNTTKTKIMVFRKRGGLRENEQWTYENENIEIVNDFNYLGTVFNYTGSFSLNQEYLSGKAIKALNVLLSHCKHIPLNPKTLCQLFDAFVGSILCYSCEVRGNCKTKHIERIHLKFLKRILKVKLNTCSNGIYGELGRYPLYVNRFTRIIKYWCKLLKTENSILKKVYENMLIDCNNGKNNWVTKVKSLLCNYGFTNVFMNAPYIDLKTFPELFKRRVIDVFIQEWSGGVNRNSVLDQYNNFKTCFGYEEYLNILPVNLRSFFTKLRLSLLPIRINTDRFGINRIDRNLRHCLCCKSTDLEDCYHFICICSNFKDLRKKYIPKYFIKNPSMFKFLELVNSSNKVILRNACLFIKEGLRLRSQVVNI